MKKIVKINLVKPNGNLTIDAYNDIFKTMETNEVLGIYLPYTRIFEHITLKNYNTIPEALLKRLTNQYLHGTEIRFVTPSKNFDKTYKLHKPKSFYAYTWTTLNLKAPIPKSLANFEFTYNGAKTTYLKAISSLKNTSYLPNEIWNALDDYSKKQIDKCKEYNLGDYAYAEEWFKELMKHCLQNKMKMFSPNEKTYYEAIAELEFEKECANVKLKDGIRPLTNPELIFLRKYAPAYGVDIPTFQFRINSRKTPHHGYTQEPERVMNGCSASDWSKIMFDHSKIKLAEGGNLPKNVRQGLRVREMDNDKLLRESYTRLLWIMKNLKDEGLMPNYKRCPKCHEVYKEHDGCECGYCKPMDFITADNMFYGISSTFEDYDATSDAYRELYTDEENIDTDLLV